MIEIDTVAVGSGMKVTCSRDELVQKLGIVSRAVSTRTTVLVLGGILLRAENGELQLAPYWWTPEGPIEQMGFIANGTSHFLLSTNAGVGQSSIERGVLQAP